MDIISQIKLLLSKPLPHTPEEVKDACRALESLREPLLALRIASQKELYVEKERLRMPKDKEYTDFDRQVMLQSAVADKQGEFDYLLSLEALVRERLELAYCLL